MLKSNLKKLTLVWGGEQPTSDADVLDGLQPHPNLRALVIENPGGTTGPSWLCIDIWVKSLEKLHLEGLSWATFPPTGQLPHLKELILKRISGVRRFVPVCGGVTDKSFMQLKKIVFSDMPELADWGVEPNCHLFPRLESIECWDCPNLSALPFSECSFTNLCSLEILLCPKLSLPPIPHTSKLTHFDVESTGFELSSKRTGSESFSYNGSSLCVDGYDRCALAFHNLRKVERVEISNASDISLKDLERFKSLISLGVISCDSMFSEELDGGIVFGLVGRLYLSDCNFTRKSLSKMLNCFPALSNFKMVDGKEVSAEEPSPLWEERVIEFPSSSSLREVEFKGCEGLVLVPAEDGGGIQEDVMSLQSLKISKCGKLFSRWPMGEAGGAQAIKPFPSSLRELHIVEESSMQSMALLSNLTSLTHLTLRGCYNLTADGFDPVIAANLKELKVYNNTEDENSPNPIAADLLSEVARSITRMPAGSFQLEQLTVDNISGVLVAPICNLLASTLHELEFVGDKRTESFTEEQEKALQLLTSLQKLGFYCCFHLQSLPQGLHPLSSLKEINVRFCTKLRSLPKDGLPTSLQKLSIYCCSSTELKEQVEELKARYPDLRVDCW